MNHITLIVLELVHLAPTSLCAQWSHKHGDLFFLLTGAAQGPRLLLGTLMLLNMYFMSKKDIPVILLGQYETCFILFNALSCVCKWTAHYRLSRLTIIRFSLFRTIMHLSLKSALSISFWNDRLENQMAVFFRHWTWVDTSRSFPIYSPSECI